ncbi:kinesin-like protein, partial [Hamiltosporidium magnivora]
MPTLLNNCTAKKTISVKIRIKPSQSSSDVPYSSTQITVNNRTYNFQHIFPPTASQPQLFEHIVPLLDSFIAGFNTTVVVYGQTGSGKTYTMGTTPEQMVYNYEGDSYSGENNTPYVNNNENNTPCISTGNNTPLSICTENNTFLNDNTVTNTPIITTPYNNTPLSDTSNINTPLSDTHNTNTHIITTTNTNTPLSTTLYTNTPLSTTPNTNTPIITTPYNNTTLTNTLGILPRSVIYLFNNINVPIILSFIEIYNEEVYDLLSDNKVPLIIRENNGIPILTGVSKHTIYSTKCAFKKLNKGLLERKTKSTKMNLNSSRSHAIITLQVKDTLLTFVDLAGSERMERSGVKGEKVKECICINSGLLSLSNVINSMYKKNKHIPFRDSKLTRLLQPSFIGQCYTLVVGCISLEGVDIGEGVNTLVYCYRICCIEGYIVRRMCASLDYKEEVLKVRKENENLIGEIRRLEGVIDMLKRENEKLRRGVSDSKSRLEGDIGRDILKGVSNNRSRLEGVSSKNMLEAVNYSTNKQQGANYSTNEQQGVNISTNKQQGVSNSIYGYKGVENKDLLNNKVFTPSKIIKGLNIGNTTINNKKEYLHDRLGGVNRSVIGDSRLRGVNKSVVGSGLRGVNNSAVECGLRGVNRSVINDRLTGVNKSVINDKSTGVNKSVINDKLTGVNKSVINDRLTGVNKSVINDRLTGVNKSVINDKLTGVNKSVINDKLTGVN